MTQSPEPSGDGGLGETGRRPATGGGVFFGPRRAARPGMAPRGRGGPEYTESALANAERVH
jgi:hypothetical protein